MSNREYARQMMEDFFSITGRPLATMTVEEYGKFLALAGQNVRSVGSEPVISGSAEPVAPPPPLPGNISALPAAEISVPRIEPDKKAEAKPRQTGASREEMLQMLRSVNS